MGQMNTNDHLTDFNSLLWKSSSSKSSIFEVCVIVFQVLVYKQMLSFFEECIIVFQAPAQFPKNKDISNTTLHQPNFGCSL